MILSVDTETTGKDLYHGALPFFVTVCGEDGKQNWWEWEVNPLTRKISLPASDLVELELALVEADELVLHNAKFDVTALSALIGRSNWPWEKTYDTLLAAHLLGSNHQHDLTNQAMRYLGVDIEPFEKKLQRAVTGARGIAKKRFPKWQLAKKGRADMPSATEKTWRYDTWLPRAVALALKYPANHPWHTVLRDYSNADSAATIALWLWQKKEIKRRGLWKIYQERNKLPRVVFKMEQRGVTFHIGRLKEQRQQYTAEAEEAKTICENVAESLGFKLNLPEGAINNSLRSFLLEGLKVPVVARSKKTGAPSFNTWAMDHYRTSFAPRTPGQTFIRNLTNRRKRMTSISYMNSYLRFGIRNGDPNFMSMHPSLNVTGTHTLRFSCNHPNEQNISKKEDSNIRNCFGPGPGREWWSLDASNIELRLPAYESGQKEFIALFERPDDPPFFGSNHLLVASILYPREWEKCLDEKGNIDGRIFKSRYKSTFYQKVKNGNFCIAYGGQEELADRTYGVSFAFRQIKSRFKEQEALNQHWISFAHRFGFVETIPDRSVDPQRGYPILCTRTDSGGIKPTVPLNFHVQGSAMWWMAKAMVRTQAQLDAWRESNVIDGYLVMQIHDELVLDLPVGSNWKYVSVLRDIMEAGGDDFGIPTPVTCERHESNWAEGVVAGSNRIEGKGKGQQRPECNEMN